MTDRDIIALYFARDERAIEKTRDKYGGFCYSIAYNLLGSREDSDECVNDTYLGAWNAMPPHKPEILSAFLAKITRRLGISRLRKRRAQKRSHTAVALDELEECVADTGLVYDHMETEELRDMLQAFLGTVPQKERDMFVCRYFYCDSIAQIATRFFCSQSKAKTTLFRTRQKLRAYLTERGVFS